MAAAEHQRARAIERLKDGQALAHNRGRQQGKPQQQREEQRERDDAGGPADGVRQRHMIDRRSSAKQHEAGNRAECNRADLPPSGRDRED
jgi:hypothetical protein